MYKQQAYNSYDNNGQTLSSTAPTNGFLSFYGGKTSCESRLNAQIWLPVISSAYSGAGDACMLTYTVYTFAVNNTNRATLFLKVAIVSWTWKTIKLKLDNRRLIALFTLLSVPLKSGNDASCLMWCVFVHFEVGETCGVHWLKSNARCVGFSCTVCIVVAYTHVSPV